MAKTHNIDFVATEDTHENDIYSAFEYLLYMECGPYAPEESPFHKAYVEILETKTKLKNFLSIPPQSLLPPTDTSSVIEYVFFINS